MISQKTFLHGGHATLRVTKHCNNNGRANIEITLTKHSLLHTMSQVLKFNGLLHYCFLCESACTKILPDSLTRNINDLTAFLVDIRLFL